jgi:hypothetical protein
MSKYRRVLTKIWDDDKFPPLSKDAQILFLYHLTSPRATPFLLYVEGEGSMADAVRMSPPRLRAAKSELAGMVQYADDGSNLVFLPKALRYSENHPASPNELKMWDRVYGEMSQGPFFAKCLETWKPIALTSKGLLLRFFEAIGLAKSLGKDEGKSYSGAGAGAGTRIPPLPPSLDFQDFRKTWGDWLAYKQQIGKPYKTEIGHKAQLSRLAKWGKARAIAAVEYSIAQIYQGVYEEKENATRTGTSRSNHGQVAPAKSGGFKDSTRVDA